MAYGRAVEITFSADERAELEALVRAQSTGQALARRARIVLLAADGLTNAAVARRLDLGQHTVGKWRRRLARDRIDALHG